MVLSLTVILVCQLIGEVLARGLDFPIPGPVIGMALMLGVLAAKDRALGATAPGDDALKTTANGLLANLSLMFVPAGVGVVQRAEIFAAHGAALAVVLVLSTLAALLVTAATFVLVARLRGARDAT